MSKVICWWSGGITSAVACKLAITNFGKENCRVIMLDTKNEHEDTYRFLIDCEKWYGIKIEKLISEKYETIEETWYRHKSLNTANGAVCSYMLKRKVREDWEKTNEWQNQVFGFEFEPKELKRARAMALNHPHTKPIFPLIVEKLNKKDCLKIVEQAGLKIPTAYSLGFSNNNCLNTGCVQGGIGYWKKIQREYPDIFDKMAKVEHELTALKGNPVTCLKDQSKKAKESGIELVFLKKNKKYPEHKSIDDMSGREPEPLTDCIGFCGVNDLIQPKAAADE